MTGRASYLSRAPLGLPARGPGARATSHGVGGADGPDLKLVRVANAFRGFLEALGLDLTDPNLALTEHRVARAYRELLAGLEPASEPELRTFPNTDRYSGIVTVDDIPFYSLCAHHFLPFFGVARVGYVPRERLLGLSKLARVVEHVARRPQLQERMTEQIAALLDERLGPDGVIVVAGARHLCMEMRGVAKPGLVTTTTAVRGVFADPRLRDAFLDRRFGAGLPPSVPFGSWP